MITKQVKKLFLVFISIAFVTSCQKVDNSDLEIAQARARLRNLPGSLTPKEELGKRLFFDTRMSEPVGMQSCASCHLPQQGFAGFGDIPSELTTRGFKSGIGEGAVAGRFGGRKPPSAAYATFSPIFNYDPIEDQFTGGLFWDGRATGNITGSPAADQAMGPFLNQVEQNHPAPIDVLKKIVRDRGYISLWIQSWGTVPLIATPKSIEDSYKKVGLAIAAYEASSEVNQFSSKFDAVRKNQASFTPTEQEGLLLFQEAECDNCHSLEPVGSTPALFTDFSYYNIGLPRNTEFLNTMGRNAYAVPDSGLGKILAASENPTYRILAPDYVGTFKTPTLRNVAKGEANKRFMHNGVLKSLKEVVHFYNTRDVRSAKWPAPEFTENMNTRRVGRLQLTSAQEDAIVAFMRTLSDGWNANDPINQPVL
jgi:cytochrome c peroxidase